MEQLQAVVVNAAIHHNYLFESKCFSFSNHCTFKKGLWEKKLTDIIKVYIQMI